MLIYYSFIIISMTSKQAENKPLFSNGQNMLEKLLGTEPLTPEQDLQLKSAEDSVKKIIADGGSHCGEQHKNRMRSYITIVLDESIDDNQKIKDIKKRMLLDKVEYDDTSILVNINKQLETLKDTCASLPRSAMIQFQKVAMPLMMSMISDAEKRKVECDKIHEIISSQDLAENKIETLTNFLIKP
jgi:hypothetical protein